MPMFKNGFKCLIGSFLKHNRTSMCRNDTQNRELISQWLISAGYILIIRQHNAVIKKGRTTLAVGPALHLPMKNNPF
jgi:hypothetical protein